MKLSRGTEVRIVKDIVENDEVVIKKGSVLKVVGAAYDDFIGNIPIYELKGTIDGSPITVWVFINEFEPLDD